MSVNNGQGVTVVPENNAIRLTFWKVASAVPDKNDWCSGVCNISVTLLNGYGHIDVAPPPSPVILHPTHNHTRHNIAE